MRKSSLRRLQRQEEFREYYQTLAEESGLEQIDQFPQHGTTTRLTHSMAVAYFSYCLAKGVKLPFHWEQLVRGALLHDYFLYDSQDGDPAHRWHWTRHPAIAAENAKKEVPLTPIEEDIIRSHMFPLASIPQNSEAWIVTLADKMVASREMSAAVRWRLRQLCRRRRLAGAHS